MIRYPTLQHLLDDTVLSFRALRAVTAEIVEARNVDNVPEIEQFIEDFEKDTEGNEEIKKWLNSNLRNFLIRDYEKVEQIDDIDDLEADPPDWLKKAIEEGKEVFHVVITPEFRDKIQHALDYLKAPEAPKKLDRVTVPEAIKQSEAWTKKLTKKKVDRAVAEEGEQIVKDYDDGYSWRRLISQPALTREGSLMGHCVERYFDKVRAHQIEIWSLRDPKNEPHVTLELHQADNHVAQIKGKQNKEVNEGYRKYVKDAMNEFMPGWKISEHEIKNCPLFRKFGKWWSNESEYGEDPELFQGMIRTFFKDFSNFSKAPEPDPKGAWVEFTLEQFLDYMKSLSPASRVSLKTYEALLNFDPEIEDEDPTGLLDPEKEQDRKAIHEGWKVGTQKAAREYAIKNLNNVRWSDGSRTMPPGHEGSEQLIGLNVTWEALENGNYDGISRGTNPKKGGWEATYDQQAAEKFLTGKV